MNLAIRADNLVKRYDGTRGLNGLSLEVPAGTVLGLLGPNGAGKTTTIRILTTSLTPDSGSAWVGGYEVVRQTREVRRRIGVCGQEAALEPLLTGQENLEMFGRLQRLGRRRSRARAQELLEQFDLVAASRRLVNTYSGGMRRRLDLAVSLLARPSILFLDEPTTGLDPRSRIVTWQLIGELVAAGTTLLLTTQYLEEADKLAHSIAVVDDGRIIAQGTADELKDRVGTDRIDIVVHDSELLPLAAHILDRAGSAPASVTPAQRLVSVPVPRYPGLLANVIRELDAAAVQLEDVSLRRPTLDDVFLALTEYKSANRARQLGGTRADPYADARS